MTESRRRQDIPLRMGGIALRNGLILVSERHWAAAIREKDGGVTVTSGTKPRLAAGQIGAQTARDKDGIPLLRGLGRFGESLIVLAQVKLSLPQAELPLEGGRVAGALAASLAATSLVRAFAPKSAVVQEIGGATAAFLPAVLALKNSPISGYHGAEHKVIGSREMALTNHAANPSPTSVGSERASSEKGPLPGERSSGEERWFGGERLRSPGGPRFERRACADGRRQTGGTPALSPAASKEHDRCGSNLVGPFLLATVVTNLIARGRSGRKSPTASVLASTVSLGVALEVLRWASRNADSVAARLLLLPGRTIQRHLTTTEPSAEQLEVGQAALSELLRLEELPI